MTNSGAPDSRSYPAPGSATPGAPPPLKRALTPADGVAVVATGPPAATKVHEQQQYSASPRPAGTSALGAAAALLGVAVGLELAGMISHRRNSKTLT